MLVLTYWTINSCTIEQLIVHFCKRALPRQAAVMRNSPSTILKFINILSFDDVIANLGALCLACISLLLLQARRARLTLKHGTVCPLYIHVHGSAPRDSQRAFCSWTNQDVKFGAWDCGQPSDLSLTASPGSRPHIAHALLVWVEKCMRGSGTSAVRRCRGAMVVAHRAMQPRTV